MNGLVECYAQTDQAQNPNLIIKWLNVLVTQLADRVSSGGIDLKYPEGLIETSLPLGPEICQRHLDAINSMKLDPFDIENDLTPEAIYTKLQSYLQRSELQSSPLLIQIKRVFFRAMNDSNWTDSSQIPWVKILTIIIEFKMRSIYFSKTGKESLVCSELIATTFDSCDEVREEVFRLSSKATINRTIDPPVAVDSDSENDEMDQMLDDTNLPPPSPEVLQIAEPIKPPTVGEMFANIENQFVDEISKSKKTLIDAKVLIQTLRKDFSRFEEIRILRTSIEEPVSEASMPILSPKKPEKPDLLSEMVRANQRRRRALLGDETFEPIDIDYGYEDAVLFDSDNEPINFEKPEEDENGTRRESLCPANSCRNSRRESSIHPNVEPEVSTVAPTQHEIDCGVDTYSKNSPAVTPQHRGSICYSHNASPHPHRHPPRVDETVGMAISDFEGEDGDAILIRSAPARIYQNPLMSGGENRLDADESRMALSDSSNSDQDDESDVDTIETHHTPLDTPVVVSSVKSLNDRSLSSDDEPQMANLSSAIEINSSNDVHAVPSDDEFNQHYDNESELMQHPSPNNPYQQMQFEGGYREYAYTSEAEQAPAGLGGEYGDYEMDQDRYEDGQESDGSNSEDSDEFFAQERRQRPPPPRREDNDSDEVICLDSD